MNSPDQTLRNRTTTARPADSPTESTRTTHKLDLSPTKIIGGALAAMTAAALGAQLSVVGTVIGAAVASTVAAVAGALYTASLERTGHRVRRVWQRDDAPAAIASTEPEPVDATRPRTRTARRRLSWSSVLVGALAAFGLAAVALTGIELITGNALSGGDGTTVSQVSGGNDGRPEAPADRQTPTPEPTATATPTSSATTEAVPTETTEPTSDPSTTEPTVTPSSPEPTETGTETVPSATPSPTGSPNETGAP